MLTYLVRKGVGSNPTFVKYIFSFEDKGIDGVTESRPLFAKLTMRPSQVFLIKSKDSLDDIPHERLILTAQIKIKTEITNERVCLVCILILVPLQHLLHPIDRNPNQSPRVPTARFLPQPTQNFFLSTIMQTLDEYVRDFDGGCEEVLHLFVDGGHRWGKVHKEGVLPA